MKKAFTLIELSIVLAIAGIIAGGLLSYALEKTEADKVKETEIILQKIEQSIANYFAEYGSIPCPADATLGLNNANFGTSLRSGYGCQGGGDGEWYQTTQYANYNLGIIPTKELQIPDELIYDAWGRRITYVLVETCNNSSAQYISSYINSDISNPNYNNSYSTINFSSACAFPNKSSSSKSDASAIDGNTYTIKDASGNQINPNAGIPYVLISHGKNGHGAYPHDGGSIRINAAANNNTTTAYNLSIDELQNAHMDASGANVQFKNSYFIQKSPIYSPGSNYFDDIVRYKTKEQLIRKSGRIPTINTLADFSPKFLSPYISNYCALANIVNGNAVNYCPASNATCINYLNAMAKQITYLCS